MGGLAQSLADEGRYGVVRGTQQGDIDVPNLPWFRAEDGAPYPLVMSVYFFFFSSRRRHTRYIGDWSSDVCSSDLPAGGVQNLNRGGARGSRAGQLGPGIGAVAVQVQGSAHEHDAAVNLVRVSTDSTDVFVFDVVGEGDGRLARVRSLFSADLQFPVQHDSLGGQFNVLIVCEAEFAVDGHTVQRRRSDVENYLLVFLDDDLVACDGHLAVGPGRRIRPVRRLGCRRCRTLGLHDSEHADEQRC